MVTEALDLVGVEPVNFSPERPMGVTDGSDRAQGEARESECTDAATDQVSYADVD